MFAGLNSESSCLYKLTRYEASRKKKEGELKMAEREERSLARFDPFEDLDIFGRWSPFRGRTPLAARLEQGGHGQFLPAVDIAEDDDRYVITVEVPGTKSEDVTIEVHGNILTIRGEKRNEREGEKEHRRWVERTYGTFSRSFTLADNADTDQVKATFENGVLTIEVPKREESKPKVISIK